MNEDDLKKRTKKFALDIIRLAEKLPKTPTCRVIHYQMVKAGTSVAANYRAACRARSKADFIAKLGIVEEESDESGFWLEMIMDAFLLPTGQVKPLQTEADEILSIMISSRKTASKSVRK